MTEVNEKDFYKIIVEGSNEGLILTKFWAVWCPPCVQLNKTLDSVLPLYPDIKCFGLNVDDNPAISELYSIKGIPTILLFKNGVVIDKIVGNVDSQTIKQFLDKGLENGEVESEATETKKE